MHYLPESIVKVWNTIKKRKLLFFLIVLLQTGIISAFFYIILVHQVKMIQYAQGVLEPLQNANFDSESLQAGAPFLNNIAPIYESYRLMVNVFVSFLGWMTFLFFIPNGIIWTASQLLLQPTMSWKESLKTGGKWWLQYAAAALIIIIPFSIITYIIIKTIFFQEAAEQTIILTLRGMGMLAIILYLILIIFLAACHANSWKTVSSSIIELFKKRSKQIISVFFINYSILAVLLYLGYKTLSSQSLFTATIIISILLLIALPVLRLFWITALNHENKTNHP